MSDSDPGAGNLCNFIFNVPFMAKGCITAGLFIKSPILRTYD